MKDYLGRKVSGCGGSSHSSSSSSGPTMLVESLDYDSRAALSFLCSLLGLLCLTPKLWLTILDYLGFATAF